MYQQGQPAEYNPISETDVNPQKLELLFSDLNEFVTTSDENNFYVIRLKHLHDQCFVLLVTIFDIQKNELVEIANKTIT